MIKHDAAENSVTPEKSAGRWPDGTPMTAADEGAIDDALIVVSQQAPDPGLANESLNYSLSRVLMDFLWNFEEIEDPDDEYDLKAEHLSLAFLAGAEWARHKAAIDQPAGSVVR